MICKNMPFQPGNQEARKAKKAKPFRDALHIEMAAAEQGQPCPAPKGSLRWNARQLLERGDPMSIQLVLTANPGGAGQHWLRERYELHPFPNGPKILTRTLWQKTSYA